MLKIVTFNLLNKPSRWYKRRWLIVKELSQVRPDIIALQEVNLPHNNAQWLSDQLGGYAYHVTSKTGGLAGKEGIAILSRYPIESKESLDLKSQSRVAQMAQINVNGHPIAFVNGHFYWHIYDHDERTRQAERLLRWLKDLAAHLPAIVCGDFNATPEMRTIQLMRQRFTSAYAAVHGQEPDYTCPTPLAYRLSSIRKGLSLAGNFVLTRRVSPWRGTLDYIFVGEDFRVASCDLVLKDPAPDDPTLYPSDHVGLSAELELIG